MSEFPLVTDLALEVERPPVPGELVNLIDNPAGALGAYGWVCVRAGDKIEVSPYYDALAFTGATSGAATFRSEPARVTPGRFAAISGDFIDGTDVQVSIEFLGPDLQQVASTVRTAAQSMDVNTWVTITQGPTVVPAGASFARFRVDCTTTAGQGGEPTFKGMVLASADTDTELTDLSRATPRVYQDVMGPTHEIKTNRSELDVGTLTATVLDASIDPAVADTFRPGRRVRLLAGFDREPLFTGELDNATVTYDPTDTGAKSARIELVAVDNIRQLGQVPAPDGVGDVDDLRALFNGAGVPWSVNGSGDQPGTVTTVAHDDNASLLDQIAVTRDSALGYAWVDRSNTARVYARESMPGGPQWPVPDGAFTGRGDPWTPGPNTTYSLLNGGAQLTPTADGEVSIVSAESFLPSGVLPGEYTVLVGCNADGMHARADLILYDGSGGVLEEIPGTPQAQPATTFNQFAPLRQTFRATMAAASFAVRLAVTDATVAGETPRFDNVDLFVPPRVLDEWTYSDLSVGFDTASCINEVTVKWLSFDAASGQSSTITYGPFRDNESINEWGVRPATFTIQGDTVAPAAYADAILAANAVPRVRVNAAAVPIRSDAEVTHLGVLDLYDRVRVVNADKALDDDSRVIGVQHTIRPGVWVMDLDFAADGTVAHPQATAQSTTSSGSGSATGHVHQLDDLGDVSTAGAADGQVLTLSGGVWSGSAGTPGPTGPSAYDVAVADGFTGSESAWLDSLVGPQGPQGPVGTRRWTGEGPPGTIIGAAPLDEYLDILTGDLYSLQ